MNRRTFLAVASYLPAIATNAANHPKEEAADYLERIVRDGLVPGAGVVASKKGLIKLTKFVGTCCRIDRREAPLINATRFPLYSFSKLITGTVVAITVTEGKLRYEDPVSRLIPEFVGGGKEQITIRHCLTHSAGLAKAQSSPVRDEAGWRTALTNLCQAEVEWTPGSRTAYHGWSGAFLAAECVRRVNGGVSWEKLCREKLFDVLAAPSLSFDTPGQVDDFAVVPQPAAGKPLPRDAQAAFGYAGQPGAGCFGTLADALQVMHLHLRGGVWKSERLISRRVFQEMHTVQYAQEIESAAKAGKAPVHEPWGLGPLLRGKGPVNGGLKWFGFGNQTEPSIFGHAGIDTLIGVGNPRNGVALLFSTSNSPKPSEKTTEIRNTLSDLVLAALRG